jgi:phosphate transport system substrate-binding protein
VASYAKKIDGGIGYVEYAYALQNNLAYVLMKNAAGNFVKPNAESFQAAAANADWAHAPGFQLVLTNQPSDKSWPITASSFILLHKRPANAANVAAALKFFDWAYREGGSMAGELAYVPMPSNVVKLVEETWTREVQTADGKPLFQAATTQ